MKKILVLNFFPAFVPPQSGGELRYFNMYSHLSQFFDITLLSPTYRDDKFEVVKHSETFREYRVPKEEIHDKLHWRMDDENICSEVSALVCSLSAGIFNRYHEVYQELYPEMDIIIHEFPYMLEYDSFFGLDRKIRIYNSHNFEYNLVKQMWKGPNAGKYLDRIFRAEEKLVKNCDLVFATSEEERQKFISVFKGEPEKIKLAPNGIAVDLYENLRKNRKNKNLRKKAFFIGSGHPPNVEAMRFLLKEVAPLCPEVEFYIAGKCCDTLSTSLNNVYLLGLVDEEKKRELFAEADVAINPMFSGAGTNLKTLEYMSAGIPVISTDVGVRGIGLEEDIHYVKAEKENFVEVLKHILSDADELKLIAENGKEFVNKHFSWSGICDNIKCEIDKIVPQEGKKKKLLVLNDYGIDKPISGGEVRCYHILKELTKEFEIVFVCLNNQGEVINKTLLQDFAYFSLPKSQKHLDEEEKVNSQYWVSATDIVTSYMIEENQYVNQFVKNASDFVDGIILEHPYMAMLIKNIRDKFIVYESHNFEYKLKKDMLEGHPLYQQLISATQETEKQALKKSDLLVSVSEKEIQALQEFSPKCNRIAVNIKNGVLIPKRQYEYDAVRKYLGKPMAIFVGSGHMPNIEAAKYIIYQVAPLLPDVYFAFIGSVCEAVQNMVETENVLLFGRVSEEEKAFLLYSSDVALNPMAEGAGSNLKLAEYFAFEIPVVTTLMGARGYEVENGREAIICPLEQFGNEIRKVLSNKYDIVDMTERALSYVKKELSWEVLGEQYSKELKRALNRKKMLVCTYRYNLPPRGGAEVYTLNVLTRIAKRWNIDIDVVTTDIGDINQKFRFACDFTQDVTEESGCAGIRVIKFPVDKIATTEQWRACREIYECFMNESHMMARSFLDKYDKPMLLGGWHYPEKSESGLQIWTSGRAEIFVKTLKEIEVKGYAPQKKQIEVLGDGQTIAKYEVNKNFELKIPLKNVNVVSLNMDTFTVENEDPRPLGVLMQRVWSDGFGEVSFGEDFKAFLKQNYASEFIQMYIKIAQDRDKKIEHLFYDVRGPHSKNMLSWMDRHMDSYDIVLAHSIPFDTIVDATRIAKQHNKPVITLPHFHMEDDFYHWNMYYETLNCADSTLCFPNVAKELFFDKINANVDLVPGGGVDPEEFLYENEKSLKEPFILVLGRKTGAKNYKWVVEAVESINKENETVKLVIIGKDEDKEPVNAKGVEYWGEQSRTAVINALKECLFVVNMSGSESFGIVILEAWMAEKPIIVNEECKAFTELVDDGVNGVYANRNNLAEKIKVLYNNRNVIGEMGKRGKIKASRKFTWDNIAQNIEAVLLREIYAHGQKGINGTYDYVFSLGASCQVAENLRRRELRKISGPFDWFTFSEVDQLVSVLQTDFQEFMKLDNLVFEGEHEGHYLLRDSKTGCVSVHDFLLNRDVEEQYREFKVRLDRRSKRFQSILNDPKAKILLVRTQYNSGKEIYELRQCLSQKYKASIDLLCINYIKEDKVNIEYLKDDFIVAEIPFNDEVMGWTGCWWAWDLMLKEVKLGE